MTASIHSTRRSTRGAALIEVACVLPLFLALILSIVDWGIFFFYAHTLQFATREGARIGLIGARLTAADGTALSREASIVQKIKECATVALDPTKVQISIYPVNPDYSDPTGWQTTQNAGQPGDYMRVTTSYQYTFITPMLGALVTGGKMQMKAQTTYKNEQFVN